MAGNPPWSEWLRHLLCQMYQYWGGDCTELGIDAPAWVATVVGEYEQSGPPGFDNDGEHAAFLLLLDQLEAHLAQPENTLGRDDGEALASLIASLRGQPVD